MTIKTDGMTSCNNTEYMKGYRDGYKDGRMNAMEEILKLNASPNRIPKYNKVEKQVFGSSSDEIEKGLKEELQRLKEREIPKMPFIKNIDIVCPACGGIVGEWTDEDGNGVYDVFSAFCPECGQALQDTPDMEV